VISLFVRSWPVDLFAVHLAPSNFIAAAAAVTVGNERRSFYKIRLRSQNYDSDAADRLTATTASTTGKLALWPAKSGPCLPCAPCAGCGMIIAMDAVLFSVEKMKRAVIGVSVETAKCWSLCCVVSKDIKLRPQWLTIYYARLFFHYQCQSIPTRKCIVQWLCIVERPVLGCSFAELFYISVNDRVDASSSILFGTRRVGSVEILYWWMMRNKKKSPLLLLLLLISGFSGSGWRIDKLNHIEELI